MVVRATRSGTLKCGWNWDEFKGDSRLELAGGPFPDSMELEMGHTTQGCVRLAVADVLSPFMGEKTRFGERLETVYPEEFDVQVGVDALAEGASCVALSGSMLCNSTPRRPLVQVALPVVEGSALANP